MTTTITTTTTTTTTAQDPGNDDPTALPGFQTPDANKEIMIV